MSEGLVLTLVTGASALGVALLRKGWRARGDSGGSFTLAGWALLAGAVALAIVVLGPARGLFGALALAGVAALAVVASGHELRTARAGRSRSLAPEPFERPSTWWRGTLRWLLALPIGMVAALGVALFYAAWTGGADQTRLVLGAMLFPLVWAICMAWTLADNRILRALAFLACVAGLGFGLAVLKGF